MSLVGSNIHYSLLYRALLYCLCRLFSDWSFNVC